jgi:hypothetical protein
VPAKKKPKTVPDEKQTPKPKMTFAGALKMAIKDRGISRLTVASVIAADASTIYRALNSDLSHYTILRVMAALKATVCIDRMRIVLELGKDGKQIAVKVIRARSRLRGRK